MMAKAPGSKYDALTVSSDATKSGAIEILRAAVVEDGVFVTARREFPDASQWGELLAEIARRVALLYSSEDTALQERDFLVDIGEAFVADLGARKMKSPARPGRSVKRRRAAAGHKTRRTTSKRAPAKRRKR
jgi:hypothetical protein